MLQDVDLLRPNEVIIRLVQDAAYARIRHRALLETLADGFTPELYYARFNDLCRRDLQPLIAQLMFADKDFERLYADWKKSTNDFYRRFWRGEKQDFEEEG